MRKFSILPATIALALGLSACDIITGPKVDETAFPTSGNKVLLEDFTGHQCGNCPRAHEKAAELKGIFGDNLIIVAVHVGGFADVDVQDGYVDDFKTPHGNELEAYFKPYDEGLPVGMINRVDFNNIPLVKFLNWSTVISQVLAEDPKLKIDVATTFDEGTRELAVTADLEYYSAGDASHQIVAVITEDSLHSQQADYSLPSPSHIEGYQQLHVLRTSITPGAWGVPVKGAQIFAGEKISKEFNIALDPAWDAKHCEVVVYVIDNDTKVVLQAQNAKVGE